MADYSSGEHQHTQQILTQAITTLRSHPEKYQAVHRALKEAKTDEARVQQLIQFATTDRELASLIPAASSETELAAITTVTITTIFILEGSAY